MLKIPSCIIFIINIIFIKNIVLPLQSTHPRCMLTFTYGTKQTVKTKILFPKIPNRFQGENFQIMLINTQTNQTEYDNVFEGQYNKQFDVAERIIYQICITLKSKRDLGILKIEYESSVQFKVASEAIVIPENLLKSEDLKGTYQSAENINKIGQMIFDFQQLRKNNQQKIFQNTRNIGNNLVKISLFELFIIIIAGTYELFAIRKYLKDKHYI